jgi:hypothetical protein
MLMLRGLEVLFAPRGVFCIAASRDYRSAADPPEAAMAVVAPGDGGVGGVGGGGGGRRRRMIWLFYSENRSR